MVEERIRGHHMRRQFAIAILSTSIIACSPDQDYLATVLEFQKHKNGGNLESTLNLFADKPTLHFGPLGTISGLNEIRGILEYDIALNTHLRFHECQANAAEVVCRVEETNDWLKLADIASITYDKNEFSFSSDGRIQSIDATLSNESRQLLGAAMVQFGDWAKSNQPVEYAELFSKEGAFVYSHDNAVKVLALLKVWRNQ